ncbi:hypothetical protein T265_03154 [Opisthorchis viverrini]|uniref:Cytoplasmic dynein 2 heavy chain 1 n=1 Tax=Opisthorchis viverrini TaxID=6198 RepID=A0A074ZTG9_OPIVI|nr:hypothetical protein T265_03154 [Opisthorchis viverrini]KER30421.1 hypothetical protein T265_03154 [Opisthorchis viverrini]
MSLVCFIPVLSLSDEVDYWRRRAKKASRNSSSEKDRAELFIKLLEPAANECARFESASQLVVSSSKDLASTVEQAGLGSALTELLNILDPVVFDVLDETWRCLESTATKPFPESRMRELIQAMGYWVVRVIQYNLGGVTSESHSSNTPVSLLWTHPFSQVKSGLQLGIEACEQWQKCSNVLTQQIWHRFAPHPWEGSPPDLSYLAQFKSRLNEVKSGLQLGIEACEQWQKCSNVLTQQIWHRFAPHPWEGSPPDLSYLAQFKSRLNEVLQIRGLYEHLRRLLTDSELGELGMSAGLGEFLFTQNTSTENSGVPAALRQLANPLNYNPLTAEQWLIGKSLVDVKFNAAEERAAIRLRTKLLTGASGDAINGVPYAQWFQLLEFQTPKNGKVEHTTKPWRQKHVLFVQKLVLADKNNVNLIFHEFHKYQDLIRRSRVSAALQSERETLLGYLEASVKEFREEFLIGSGSNTDKTTVTGQSIGRSTGLVTAKNIPEQVNRMLWAGQLESRAKEDLKLVECLLSDLARYPAYKQEVTSLIEEMSCWRREQFESWSRCNLARLDGQGGPGSLSFDPSRPILNLSTANGFLEVGFPDALVQLQREVRLLVGLGYAVPMKLIHAADQAEALHRYAIVLKQVAHFYNSIDSQMIPSQQALMLNSAMAFERLIKSPKTQFRLPPSDGNKPKDLENAITWNQTEELESYINQLQNASRQLMMENRKLRKVHFTIMEKIIRLLDVDLLRNQSRWRNELADVRYMLAELANQGGYPADHMAPWKAHLDRQLYKVLEYQYRVGLDEINERMPEIRVDMVYQQSRLAFKPPFEEIKAKYYREMRKFICIPNYFRGVSDLPAMARDVDNSELPELIFPLILDNQSNGLRVCYRKAEFLFTRLIASLDQFRNWVVLGSVNLDELVDSHCRDLADFERNFRALKTRGRDAEKLPTEIKIDCVTVNCLPVKNAIEGMLQNLFETLQTCLRRSIHGELVAADAFLTDALEKLSYRPQTVDELSEAKAREVEFSKARSRLVEQVTCAEAKDRLLRGVAGSGVQALGATKAKWDKFQLMMESFRMMMNEQLEATECAAPGRLMFQLLQYSGYRDTNIFVMKSNVEARTKNYVNSLEKFASRWHQLKPGHELLDSGDREACKAAIYLVRERQAEFTELETLRESVIRDHVHFEMTPPSFGLAEELATDLKTYESMWSEFEAFNNGVEEFAKEDWISFRTKYYLFDEFLASWFNKLRATEVTPMTVCLQKAIDQYRELLPALKWVRGEALSQDHWIELFRLIGLPKSIRLEQLNFGDLLSVSKSIVAQSGALKTLTQRAQAEVVVREALQELDVWGAGATFVLTEYIDSSGQVLYLVKDWKDIVSQVGDNMALLASLQDSPYFDSFADRANAWAQRLADLDHSLNGLQAVQRRWVYLEPIIGRGALPKEAARFLQVDAEFRRLLMAIKADNRVVSLVSGHRANALKEQLTNMQTFTAEPFFRNCQLNSYRLLDKEAKLSDASCLQKLNIHALFERVFLNFPGYSLTVLKSKQMLQSGSTDSAIELSFQETQSGFTRKRTTRMPPPSDQLARCQRALNEYLEEKRSVFPRFYFLGDDDLLEILGQATNPSVVQTHLRKLFQGIHHVLFEVDGDNRSNGAQVKKLKAMCSLDGEVVCLQRPIQLTPEVELWLGRLATGMQATLNELLAQCLDAGSIENRRKHSLDPNAYPGQILTLAEAINFSRNVEEALSCGRLSVLKKDLQHFDVISSSVFILSVQPPFIGLNNFFFAMQAQLAAYTSVDLNALRSTGASADNSLDDNTVTQTGNLVMAAKLSTLILDTIHMIDVADQLIQAGAATTRDWAWQRQLRFYGGPSGKSSSVSAPRVCMVDAEFVYTFEYQGNARRLVHTPLTDKCYLTLTQAMRMGLGGNPYGPAGTGKTESVKALGGLMGRQVLVFNCDEGIDVRSMGRILVGIVKCGAWGCFDEFNRLEEAVLSAVSMQIQVIQDGLRSSSSHITLLNRSISLDPNSGLFITLNPAGKGYGGRQKLPDNLKQLFRPVAMSQPDVDLIAEMILFSEGFRHARLLGRKLVSVFALARQLLSVQQHYDWGLRALKTVLHSAGCLLHAHQSNHPHADPTTRGCATESRMVIRAARTNTLAKLTCADVGRFEALLRDQHYDWGLRALKTVLHSAGCLLHAHQSNHPHADPTTRGCATESRMVIRAARTNTLAKLTCADVGRFEALLRDVFPEPELHVSSSEDPELTTLTEALHAVVEENRMVLVEPQIQKALEVYEQTKQRMGVVLVGPSGCGKSTILRLLRMALAKVGRPLRYHVFNPKAMLRVQLLGRIDPDTREWTDGVLTYSARCVVKEDSSQSCWIVCDGDIDPEWVESLNSVLDDNRLLTLPNGERIQFGPNVNFLFETHELTQASPATVSRMGVVYVSEESTEPRALVGAWLAQQPEQDRDQLELLINQSFYTCLDWVYQKIPQYIFIEETTHKFAENSSTAHHQFHSSWGSSVRVQVEPKNDFVLETSPAATVFNGLSHLVGATTTAQFAVGMIRGLGANLTEASREALALQVYEATGETPPDPTRPLDVQVDKNCPTRLISYPPGTSIVLLGPGSLSNTAGGCTEFSSTSISTDSALAHAAADGLASGYPPLVLTPTVRRSIDAFRCWLDDPKARQSFLLVGPEGCGKSRLLDYCFAMFNRSAQVATIQCSAQTTPIHLLEKLSQCCMTVTSSTAGTIAGRVLRPREGERLILYLRDLNLAKPDKWGSCQLTAFLQQLLTYHGYYDPVNLEFVGVEGIQFVGSITPATTSAGLGRHLLSPRFTSALRLTVITYPERDQLISIYTCLLQAVVHSHLAANCTSVCDSRASKYTVQAHSTKTPPLLNPVRLHMMSSIMVQLLDSVQQQFRADEHAHCVFTPHLLTRWTAGLLRYELNGSVNNLWAAFGQEARCVLRNRLPGERARSQFDTLFSGLVYSNLSSTTTHGEFSGGDEIQTILKFATGEVDELYDFCGESESPRGKSSEEAGWFVTWGAKEAAPPGSPIPLHGRPLGFMVMSHIREVCERGLTQIAREQCPKAAELALFPEFIDLICRIERVLTRPAGSLLLAGRSGIGRRSALNLVTHLHQFEVHRLRVGRDYTVRHFVGDVKVACQAAGIDSQPTVLLIEDHQLTHDAMLEIINSLLACGEASGLFTADELEALATNTPPTGGVSLREAAAEASHRGPISSFFAQRVRANLHFVIVLDVDDSDQLTARLRANPSAYKHCEVQWVDNWTRNSLLNLPKLLISAVRVLPNVEELCQAFTSLHNTAPHLYMATPRRYLALCAAYAGIEQTHRSKLEARASRLQAGLAKLKEARRRVCQLKKSAAEQGEQLAEKQTAADKALEQISAAMQGAAEQRTEMENLRSRVAEESRDLERRKAAIDTELSEIEPLVQQARAAVGSIRPEALSEIRALRAPPDVIRDILEGVLLLMGIRDTSWVSMRGFLAKRGVQEEILTFDARKISAELRTSVEKLLAKNQDSFDPKIAKRASVAAAPLATWVRANVKYATVLERIAPLEAEQAQLQGSLSQAESSLKALAEELAGVDARVGQLRAVFEQHTAEATRLKVELDRAKETLASAEALVGELEGEHARWKKQVNELTVKLTALPPLALLSAAFITYLSASPEHVRKSQMCEWVRQLTALGMTIPNESLYLQASSDPNHFGEAKGFDVLRFLTTEREQLVWRNQGLPSDQLSIENAVVILETGMCPFIVDPSSRALNWLKQHLRERKVEVVSQRSANFTTTLELAVRFGKSLIIQEVDEIEPILFPLLSGSLIFQGGRSTVLLGDKTVDYHPDFRLFLCTRQTPTSIGTIRPASASSLVTVVNFVTTRAGLVNQLLAASLHHERPQMEEKRQNLVREEERMKLELAKLEDDLLEALANAHGNILENKELLLSLNKTKQSSMTISDSLKESSRLQAELDKERDVFYPLAEAGSRVYFALTELVKINWMYQFSLNSFLHLFEKALEAVYDPSLPTAGKVAFLHKRLEALAFAHVSQALFKADRPMFTMHMARCLRPEAITEEEWQFFTGVTVTDPQIDTKSAPSWLDPDRVRDVLRFKAALPAIYSALRLDEARIWSGWMSHHSDGGLPPPANLQSAQLTPFQLDVLAVQALRPDRLQTAMLQFANRCLDLPHLGSSTVNLSRLYEHETRATEPILLLISPGADPSQELAEAAAARFGNRKDSISLADSHYRQVAMGQGQADLAISELHAAAEAGDWLCLKNLHLVIPWLPTLEKEINSLLLDEQVSANDISNRKNTGDGIMHVHQNFRLWLTAEPHAGFPSALLQTCLKVAYEAPPGLKRNLRRTYESWTRSYLAQGNSSNRATTLAALAWFHAVVQERRNYIPQGWTKFYEFSYADLRAAADVIDRLLLPSGSKTIVKDVWAWIHGLFEGTVYGGRMDNQSDVLVLQSYLVQMFSDETLRSLKLGPLRLPGTTELKDYTTLIESLPDYDQPSNFNLPTNIDRSAQRSAANRVIAQLRLLGRTVGKTSKFDKVLWSQELGPILVLWKKLNQGAPLLQRSASTNPESSKLRSAMSTTLKTSSLSGISKESPVVEFLRLELNNALHLVHTVHAGLAGLSRTCRGTQLLTTALRQLAESLLHGETPDSWLAEWPEGPEDPVSFLRDLVAKAIAVQNLMKLAETKQFLRANSPPIDLADLFRPTTFLNAVRQQTARQLGVAIDTLKLVCAWPGQSNQSSTLSEGHIPIRIAKLKLEGAVFESDQLAPSQPESPSLVYLPELTLIWIEQDMPDFIRIEASISLPVYLDSARQHLVTYLRVPCPTGTQNQWIQAGTALLLTSL